MMDNGDNLGIISSLVYRHSNTRRGYSLLEKPRQGILI